MNSLDLSTRPTTIEAVGVETLSVLEQIARNGGIVLSMSAGKENGHWCLKIQWPNENELNFNSWQPAPTA